MLDHYLRWVSMRPKQKLDFQIIIWATLSLSTLHLLSKALESAFIPFGDLPNDLPPKVCVLIALWSCKNILLVAGCFSCKKIPSTSSSSLPLLSPLCPGVDVIGTQSGEDLSFLISWCCYQWYLRWYHYNSIVIKLKPKWLLKWNHFCQSRPRGGRRLFAGRRWYLSQVSAYSFWK